MKAKLTGLQRDAALLLADMVSPETAAAALGIEVLAIQQWMQWMPFMWEVQREAIFVQSASTGSTCTIH